MAVKADPDGAVVRYMPAGHWDLYQFQVNTKKLPNVAKPGWITIRQGGKINFAAEGQYHFNVKWPDKKPFQEIVQISNDNDLIFTPNGVDRK